MTDELPQLTDQEWLDWSDFDRQLESDINFIKLHNQFFLNSLYNGQK